MSFFDKVNSYHLDVLKEIGNIGAGNATTALSKLLNKKVDMTVPFVKIVSFNEMMEIVGGADSTIASVFLRIEGDAPGSMYFMLPLEQATAFVHKMTGDNDFTFDNLPFPDLAMSALQEVGNIVAGSYLSALSDFTSLSLYPSVPALSIDMVGAVLSYGLLELSQVSDFAVVIDTAVTDKDNLSGINSVTGHFILLPDPESFHKIFASLGVNLDE